jgi:two-component system invasion response regulator UvrY
MQTTKPITIAIADDHPCLRAGIMELIYKFGNYELAMEAGDGKEFLEKFDQLNTQPDLCMLDISMPIMNGFDTLKELKQKWPTQKVIIFSHYDESYNVIRCFREGANAFLSKRAAPGEMEIILNTVHEKGSYYANLMLPNLVKAIQNKQVAPDVTEKEKQFLNFCCSDLSYDEIAEAMKTSIHCVHTYRDRLFEKLNVHSRAMLVIYAITMGIYIAR